MKKIIGIIIIIALVYGGCYYEHNYTREECVVVQVKDGYATIEDKTGNYWDVLCDGLEEGDIVDLKMHDNYSSNNIEDDIVKDIIN